MEAGSLRLVSLVIEVLYSAVTESVMQVPSMMSCQNSLWDGPLHSIASPHGPFVVGQFAARLYFNVALCIYRNYSNMRQS